MFNLLIEIGTKLSLYEKSILQIHVSSVCPNSFMVANTLIRIWRDSLYGKELE